MNRASTNTRFLSILGLFVLLAACNPTRKLADNEYLLKRNIIVDKKTEVEKAELESYIKQKPNRKILSLIRFHLWLYNLANKPKVEQKRFLKNKKIDEKNIERAAKGKKPLSKDRLFFGEWLLQIGEPPVILDSMLMEKSVSQMKLFLSNKGYFNSEVRDSVVTHHKYANVFYLLKPSVPCTIRSIHYKIDDSQMAPYIMADTANSLIKVGNKFDVDVLQKERDRITTMNKNNGYYYFTKEYIYYRADSFLNTRSIDLVMGIKKFARPFSEGSDSIVEVDHTRYYIRNIYVVPDYNPMSTNKTPTDTVHYSNFIFLLYGPLNYKPRVIADAIYISNLSEDHYQAIKTEDTYKRLTELRAFRSVNIRFTEAPGKKDMLDCYIRLSPVLKQAFLIEAEGTNTSGNLGIAGSVVYQNRNTFHGAEILEIKLKGGLEAQQPVNKSSGSNGGLGQIISEPFNTIQVGPEANLTVPRPVFPFSLFHYSKDANPKSTFTTAFNYQHRPDYSRWILNFSHGLTYKETATQRYTFTPLEINFVKVDPQPAFREALEQSNDIFLINSYSDHLTPASRFTYIYNNQDIKRKHKNFSFFKGDVEYSGIGLTAINDLLGSEKKDGASYRIIDIVYSHYVRFFADYRFYKILSTHDRLVFRAAFGEGFALRNLNVLPFEKSFYGGSSNGIRAWHSRSLGPGGYVSSFGQTFDQTGDIQIESNLEYRFNLFRQLNAAFFLDGGNIWLRKPDSERPGAEFDFDNFYEQLALGGGIGARLDFGFFIIRLDLGVKLRDPQFPQGNRWVVRNIADAAWKKDYENEHGGGKEKRYSFANLNLGIGYPF